MRLFIPSRAERHPAFLTYHQCTEFQLIFHILTK